jgi:uncharacterized DUF497 family protein
MEPKNVANQRKHGISFEEASELFSSESDYLEIFDETHSDFEDRFIAIGPIRGGIVVVAWTEDDEAIRVINARWATRRERALYRTHMDENR